MNSAKGETPKFTVILEKKGRGRGLSFSRPWAIRTFKLIGQELQYFDGEKLKGTISTKDSTTKILSGSEADNKSYPFELDIGTEKLVLNASSAASRQDCMDILNYSSNDKNWKVKTQDEKQEDFNNEATLAVLTNMKSDAEVKKLEAEQKVLDEKYEAEASAAVVGAMAADLEKQKLEAEAKLIEEKRLKETNEATAALMQEQLAIAERKKAEEAAKQQQVENVRKL